MIKDRSAEKKNETGSEWQLWKKAQMLKIIWNTNRETIMKKKQMLKRKTNDNRATIMKKEMSVKNKNEM